LLGYGKRGITMLETENNIMLYEAKKARHKPHIVVQVLIFFAVFIIANIASGTVVSIPLVVAMFKDIGSPILSSGDFSSITEAISSFMKKLPEWFTVLSLFSTAITTICAIIYCTKIEGRSIVSMGIRKRGVLKNYGLGFVIGIVMISAAAGLSALLGGSEFTGFNAGVPLIYIALFFLGYLVQGMSEEVCVRGYFMVSCTNKVSVGAAVFISSVAFASLHLANPGISPLAFVNLALFGIFTAVYILRTDNLWGACAVHSAWNFFQGNVYGISVSGSGKVSSVFGTHFVSGHELFSGGSFGIEGGICTTVVLVAGIGIALLLPQKPRPEILPEKDAAPSEKLPRQPLPVYKVRQSDY
jgi:uncharacterized protein